MSNKAGVVAYIRVSTTEQEISPVAQREVIERWVAYNGLKLVSWHEDIGVSGSVPWFERPGLSEAVTSARRNGASWLVVARMDRLSRDLFGQLHLGRTLDEFGARVISCTESPEDQNTPEKELMQNVLGSMAQYERAMIRSRIKAALAVRKAQGMRLGSPPLSASEYGRCVLWYIWLLHDQGVGTARIAKLMNEQGVQGPRGGRMFERNIQRILKKDRPTEAPKAWRGPEQTWKNFARRSKDLRRNRTDPSAPGRPSTGGGVAATAEGGGE